MTNTVYVVWKRQERKTLVRLRSGKWSTWKNSKGFGALRTCVSLHSRNGAERLMKSAINNGAKAAGYISSSELSKDESFTARAIKRGNDPS